MTAVFVGLAAIACLLVDLLVFAAARALLRWRDDRLRLRMQARAVGLTVGRRESRRSLRGRISKALRAPVFRGTKREYQELVAEVLGIAPEDIGVERAAPDEIHLTVPRRVRRKRMVKAQMMLVEYAPAGFAVLVVWRTA